MKLNTWLALSSLGLAALSGYLAWRIEQVEARVVASDERADALQAANADLEQALATLQANHTLAAQQARRDDAAADGGRSPLGEPSPAAGGLVAGKLTKSLGPMSRSPQLAPEHVLTGARMRYGALFHELGLSEQEIAELLQVLSEREPPERRGLGFAFGVGRPQPETEQERAQREAAVSEVIGSERGAQLEGLIRTLPVRGELGVMRMQLESLGAPMTSEQHSQLLAIMSARGPRLPPQVVGTGDPQQAADTFRKWRAEQHQQVLGEAAQVLSPQQLKRLEESQAFMRPCRLG
ncbi:MAG: hypothetical protein ABW321_16680 [Polyangiales bacterium]